MQERHEERLLSSFLQQLHLESIHSGHGGLWSVNMELTSEWSRDTLLPSASTQAEFEVSALSWYPLWKTHTVELISEGPLRQSYSHCYTWPSVIESRMWGALCPLSSSAKSKLRLKICCKEMVLPAFLSPYSPFLQLFQIHWVTVPLLLRLFHSCCFLLGPRWRPVSFAVPSDYQETLEDTFLNMPNPLN